LKKCVSNDASRNGERCGREAPRSGVVEERCRQFYNEVFKKLGQRKQWVSVQNVKGDLVTTKGGLRGKRISTISAVPGGMRPENNCKSSNDHQGNFFLGGTSRRVGGGEGEK